MVWFRSDFQAGRLQIRVSKRFQACCTATMSEVETCGAPGFAAVPLPPPGPGGMLVVSRGWEQPQARPGGLCSGLCGASGLEMQRHPEGP